MLINRLNFARSAFYTLTRVSSNKGIKNKSIDSSNLLKYMSKSLVDIRIAWLRKLHPENKINWYV